MQYHNGTFYRGSWEKGKQQGRGLFNFGNGDTYDGEWLCGKMHGRGVLMRQGQAVDVQWERGKLIRPTPP